MIKLYNMIFRRANKKDLEGILEMGLLLWPKHTKEELRKEITETLQSDSQAAFVCLGNGGYLGFSTVSLRKEYVPGATSYPVGYFEGIFVRKEFRGKGIAKKLSTLGERWLKLKRVRQIGSDTWDWNKGSISFHKNLGFRKVDTLVHFIKDIK